jgi:hypothetical protein
MSSIVDDSKALRGKRKMKKIPAELLVNASIIAAGLILPFAIISAGVAVHDAKESSSHSSSIESNW